MNPRSRQLARIKEQENKPTSVQKVLPCGLALLKPAMWGKGEGAGQTEDQVPIQKMYYHSPSGFKMFLSMSHKG